MHCHCLQSMGCYSAKFRYSWPFFFFFPTGGPGKVTSGPLSINNLRAVASGHRQHVICWGGGRPSQPGHVSLCENGGGSLRVSRSSRRFNLSDRVESAVSIPQRASKKRRSP